MLAKLVEKANDVIELLDNNEDAHPDGDSESATASHKGSPGDEQSKLADMIVTLMGSIASKLANLEQIEQARVREGPEIRTPYEQISNWLSGNVEQVQQTLVQKGPEIKRASSEHLANLLSVSKDH